MPKAQLQFLSDELEKLREQKLYQKLRILETEQLPVARFDGKEVINLSSNNYLGLTTHPKLRRRALEAIERYGVGSGAVRTIAGTMTLHMALEEKIAQTNSTTHPSLTAAGSRAPKSRYFPTKTSKPAKRF